MLPISELVRFGALLDADWHSPVADAAAVRWAAERPVFLRSSASHVLVARRPVGPRIVLRLRPDDGNGGGGADEVLSRGARAARDWRDAGGPVAGPVPSLDGRLVEHVDGYVVTALEAVEGEPLDDEELVPGDAREWGVTVARAHEAGRHVDPAGLPTTESFLDVEATGVPAPLGRARAGVLAALVRLPRDPAVHGVLHGDPEPDNVVAGPGGQLLVDPDEVRLGWFVSDVGFALRAWAPADDPCAAPDLSAPVPAPASSGSAGRSRCDRSVPSWSGCGAVVGTTPYRLDMVFWQLTVDANDPALLARFWSRALGYQPGPPDGTGTTWWAHYRRRLGGEPAFEDRLFDPAGRGPALWFQQVPERKGGKNRLHLDLYPTGRDDAMPQEQRVEVVDAKVAELVGLGASVERRTREDDPDDPVYYVVMHDPEGNEFCVS